MRHLAVRNFKSLPKISSEENLILDDQSKFQSQNVSGDPKMFDPKIAICSNNDGKKKSL